jgi:outer membrane receptor protein involved in Fe transport
MSGNNGVCDELGLRGVPLMHRDFDRRKATSLRKWLLAATSLTVLAPVAAFAQNAAPADQAAATDTKPAGLGEIVVTATRRSENVQKVPISLQALTPEKLEQRQVVNFADYAALLPSVSYASLGPGRSDLYFRGISFDSEGAGDTSQQSVAGIYLDEIPMTTAGRMPEVHVYDMARVEALSGPQGTLFGSSSLSGTLRLITNKPKLGVFEGGYDVEVNKFTKGGSNTGTVDEGFINIPVAKNVAIRMMAYYDHTGGYIDNVPATHTYPFYSPDPNGTIFTYDANGNVTGTYSQTSTYTISNSSTLPANSVHNIAKRNANPVDEYGGRMALLAQFGDWSILPQVVYQYLDAKGSFNFDPNVGDLQVHDFGPTENRDAWVQAALTINGKVGDFDLVSSTGYFHRRIKNSNDYTYYTVAYDVPGNTSSVFFHDKNGNQIDPTQEYYGNNTFDKFTQEVRLSVPKSWPFTLTVGAFYQWQKKQINEEYSIAGLSSSPDGYTSSLRDDAFYLTETNRIYNDYAVFAEGTYPITTQLKLTGGLRLFRAKDRDSGFEGVAATAQANGCTTPFTGPRLTACDNVSISTPYNQSGETHKVTLNYQIAASKMVYATYSTGFRPGGNNTIAPTHPYKADTLSNFELGAKTSWGPNFRINAAVYYEKWKGVQYFIVPIGFNGNGLTLNAGNARVYGVESDFDWHIGNLSLSGSGAYNDAALSSDFCGLTGPGSTSQFTDCAGNPGEIAAYKGTRLPRQPKFKGQMQARYTYTIAGLDAFTQLAANHQSSSTSNLDATKDVLLGDVPGFTSGDFSTGVSKDKWSLEFFIENFTDTRGQLSRNTFCAIEVCSGSTRTLPSRPRFVGLKFSNKF